MTKSTKTEVATTEAANLPAEAGVASTVDFDASAFELVQDVVLPILQMPVGVTRGVQITGPLFEGKEIKDNGKASRGKATLANVINLADNQRMQIVVPTVLEANLREAYPDDSYVNKLFVIRNMGKRQGKEYNDMQISEIAPKADA